MKEEVFELSAIDFYDWDELDKIRERRDKKEVKLMGKAFKGDKKAMQELQKHRKQNEIMKEKSRKTGYYWY